MSVKRCSLQRSRALRRIHVTALLIAMLNEEETTWFENESRLIDDVPHDVEPVWPAVEGDVGVVIAHLRVAGIAASGMYGGCTSRSRRFR